MLCRLPAKFCDGFVTTQEWELDTRNGSHSLRLDFLNRLSLPSSTRFESPAFYSHMRSSLLGSYGSLTKDIQSYHVIDHLFSNEEERSILRELNFYHRPPIEAIRAAFTSVESERPAPGQSKVVINELLDEAETIPLATLTTDAVVQLHALQHERYRRRSQGIFPISDYPLF